jgi:hypothetical protein
VLADDGKEHVEYAFLLVNAFSGPVILTLVEVLDPAGKVLSRIEGDALNAATQTLLTQVPGASIPASAAASLDVDLVLPPGTAPATLRHRITYTLGPNAPLASIIGSLVVEGVEVAVDTSPALVIKPPLTGKDWLAANGCCAPNIHRDTRIAIGGSYIATPETFAIDWVLLKNGQMFEGDGSKNEQHFAFGADLLAVADGTVIATRDGMPEEVPFKPAMSVKTPLDYAGNHVIVEIAPNTYAVYGHIQTGSVKVKPGDRVKAGDRVGRLGNSGNTTAPHLHFAILDKPDFIVGKSLPYVIDSYVYAGEVQPGENMPMKVIPANRPVTKAYPLYLGIQDYP